MIEHAPRAHRVRAAPAFVGAGALAMSLCMAGCAASSEPAVQPIDIAALVEDSSDYQKEILSDGQVTYGEYERAVLAERQCVLDAGASPTEVEPRGNNELGFDYEVLASSDDELERINADADACKVEYSYYVGQVWAHQQLLSPEEREELRPQVAECLIRVGLPLAPEADFIEIVEAVGADQDSLETSRPCIQKYAAYFSVSDAGGTDAH